MSAVRRHKTRHIVSLGITIICVLLAAWMVANRQFVLDQLSVWQYRPSDEIVSLAERSEMTGKGTFYFYASQPVLEGSTVFNEMCGRKEQGTAILGCYNGQRVYIYDVQDAKLDGIREVTAAHEMLHVAYQRLGAQEKQSVNALLEAEYNKLKDDEKFAERMAFYARTEPGERDNELHSIIGTEIKTIGGELEQYYKNYFANRQAVVSLHEKYAGVFLQLQSQSESLAAELARLADEIEEKSSQYNSDVKAFNDDVEAFKRRVDAGDFSTVDEYQSVREALLARGSALDQRRSEISSSVERYDDLRKELQSVASQSDALNRSIDSSLAPAPSL